MTTDINIPEVRQALWEHREFSWEYSETKGYVLRGRLAYRSKGKFICHTYNWKMAIKIACLIGDLLNFDGRWQQLAMLICKVEQPVPRRRQPTPKIDTLTLDLFEFKFEAGSKTGSEAAVKTSPQEIKGGVQ